MALWRIIYEDWQMECCGDPFSVGDEVRWRLSLRAPDDVGRESWEDSFSALERDGAGLAQGPGVSALVGEEGATGQGPLLGLLAVETHGPGPGDVPETVGTVRSVQIVTEGYVATATGSRTYVPVPGDRTLRAVDACPKWFRSEPGPPRRDGRGYDRNETGVLVTLETPGTAAGR